MVRETWPWGHKKLDIIKHTCKRGRDVNYISKKIKISRSMAGFSSETMKNDIYKVLKGKKKRPINKYSISSKTILPSKVNIKTLPNEQNQRESCMARRPVIQEILKSVL